MTFDPFWIWIALGAVAVLVVVGLITRGARSSQTQSLREKFGREYDHAVEEHGRKNGERALVSRQEEVGRFPIRPLTATERNGFRNAWQRVERQFIERPAMAVVEADEIVADIMRLQGYPMGDFDKHAAHLSVTHPSVVEHYRSGHKTITDEPGKASTEDLRQAMLHYRALFDELVSKGSDVAVDIPRQNEVSTSGSRNVDERSDDVERRL